MKNLLLLCLLFSLSSCFLFQEKGIVFNIENTSGSPITKVTISTSENLDSITFDKIDPNDYRQDFLSMKNNTLDGSYTLSFIREDGSLTTENLGYYTNGGPLERWIRFKITHDTTLVQFGDFN